MKLLPRRKIKPAKFKERWKELQKLCGSKDTWTLAVINADKLLDEALKKKHFKGKSMGERLVEAQRQLTDNDAVWFAHNLAKKLLNETAGKLKESDVKKSLIGFRQALRDLGALE
jgi:hypothetical protein